MERKHKLIELKDSVYVEELMECVDSWLLEPNNMALLSPEDDHPQFAWAPSRSKDPSVFNDTLGTPFYQSHTKAALVTKDFVSLDDDGKVMGYFHCTINHDQETNLTHAHGIRCYRFKGSHYQMGLAQREFYEWLNDNMDTVTVMFLSDGVFTNGEVTTALKKPTESLLRVFKRNKDLTGFAQPGLFRNLIRRYRGVFSPYVVNYPDMFGNDRLLHMVRWRGKPGVEKNIPPFTVEFERSLATKELLKKKRILDYC